MELNRSGLVLNCGTHGHGPQLARLDLHGEECRRSTSGVLVIEHIVFIVPQREHRVDEGGRGPDVQETVEVRRDLERARGAADLELNEVMERVLGMYVGFWLLRGKQKDGNRRVMPTC